MMRLEERPVGSIRVGEGRGRQAVQDIDDIRESIDKLGLLHPIGIAPDNSLVYGGRRLEAVRSLGWETVPVIVLRTTDDELYYLECEYAENVCRRDFTPSEMVAMGERLEKKLSAEAAERKTASQAKPGAKIGAKPDDAQGGDNLAPPTKPSRKGRTSEKVAEAVGTSHGTYKKAKKVVAAAAADPSKADIVETMDATGNVNAAVRELKERQQEEAVAKSAPPPTDAAGLPIPVDLRERFASATRIAGEMRSHFRALNKLVTDLCVDPGGVWYRQQCQKVGDGQKFHCKIIREALAKLEQCLPYCSCCPYCEAKTPGEINPRCEACKGLGWGPKSLWTRAPDDERELATATRKAGVA